MLRHVDPDAALSLVLERTSALAVERVPLEAALGRTLAEELVADRDYPPFDRAAMDGYAVRVADAGASLPVAFTLAAGVDDARPLPAGAAVEIMTGAPCPAGTEAVVAREETTSDGARVVLPQGLRLAQNVASRGSERRAGAGIVVPGAEVTPLVVAVAASIGRGSLSVVATPSLAIVVTGDELVGEGERPGAAAIRDSNGPMLEAMARALGVRMVERVRAADRKDALYAALDRRDVDVVVASGGVSAGAFDFVPSVLEGLGAEIVFHKVTQRPGKPLLFARREQQLFFGLPGNPLGAHLGFARYVGAALRRLCGRAEPAPVPVRITAPVRTSGERTSFVLCRLEGERVTPLFGKGSADVFAAALANAYLRLPPGEQRLEAGAPVLVTPL